MKAKIFLAVLFSILVINGIVGQIVNVAPNPSSTQHLNQCVLLDQKIWLGDDGVYPTFYYSGSSWTENYDCQTGNISGAKGSNGQDVVYQMNQELYRWNNTSGKWNIISGRPSNFQGSAKIKVVDENSIYLLPNSYALPRLYRYTGSAFVELFVDTSTYYEDFLYADTAKVVFSRRQDVGSNILSCYFFEGDTVVDLVTIPGINGIKDVQSANGRDFFILARNGNLYRYNIYNQVLVNLIICPENEQSWFNETLEVASTNRLIFLGGSKGIKKVWISNNGDPISEVIFPLTNPEHKFLSSSHYGSRMIFAGVYGSFELQTAQHVIIDYTTGVIETILPDVTIYPNPSKDWIKIDGLTELSDVQIFDITGKLILQQEYQLDEMINIANLTAGMYILKIRNSQGMSSKKIIKQ
jgi:hypothetical protein